MLKVFIILLSIASVQAQEICEFDHITGSKKLANLSDDAIKAMCAVHEENKCQPEIEETEPDQHLNPDRLADSLIRRDKAGKKLIGDLFKRASAEDKSLTPVKLESLLKAKIVEFVKAKNCEPTFGESNASQDYDDLGGKVTFKGNGKEKALSALQQKMRDPAFVKSSNLKQAAENQKKFYDFLNHKSIKEDDAYVSLRFCSKELVLRDKATSEFPNPTCTGSVSKYFVDNFAELKPQSEEARHKDQQAITKCITDTKAAGYEPVGVTIKSSANKLKNTASIQDIKEGRGFCGFDFLSLSKARAEFAKNKLLPELIPMSSKIPVTLNTQGDDGMGAAGECPYDANGKTKPEYVGAGSKKLEKHKTTEIIVQFKPTKNNTNAPSLTQNVRIGSNCSAIRIKCKGEL